MAGISSSALNPTNVANKNLFNGGSELQNKEFADGTGWEMYASGYRNYDPQIGRFHQIDPLSDMYASVSPYNYALNNPISMNDPMGLAPRPMPMADIQVGGGGTGAGKGWFKDPYNRESFFDEPSGFGGSSGQTMQGAIDNLWNSPHGGTATADGNGGFNTSLFGSESEAFAAGMAYTDLHNGWGNNGTATRAEYEDAYYKQLATEREADGSPNAQTKGKALKILGSLVATDPNKTTAGKILQVLSHFTWELPQQIAGILVAEFTALIGGVEDVYYSGGALVIENRFMNPYLGFTIGNIITVGEGPSEGLVQHEYGHYIQSRRFGPSWILSFGLPSLIRAGLWSIGAVGGEYDSFYTESNATKLGRKYYSQ